MGEMGDAFATLVREADVVEVKPSKYAPDSGEVFALDVSEKPFKWETEIGPFVGPSFMGQPFAVKPEPLVLEIPPTDPRKRVMVVCQPKDEIWTRALVNTLRGTHRPEKPPEPTVEEGGDCPDCQHPLDTDGVCEPCKEGGD